MTREQTLRRRIKWLTWFFIFGLVLSGATAIPLKWELDLLVNWFGLTGQTSATATSELGLWLLTAREALQEVSAKHPLLFYGTDWLAFGHFVIAMAFIQIPQLRLDEELRMDTKEKTLTRIARIIANGNRIRVH